MWSRRCALLTCVAALALARSHAQIAAEVVYAPPVVSLDRALVHEMNAEIGRAGKVARIKKVWSPHTGPGGPYVLRLTWSDKQRFLSMYRVGTVRECVLSSLWWFQAHRQSELLPPLG